MVVLSTVSTLFRRVGVLAINRAPLPRILPPMVKAFSSKNYDPSRSALVPGEMLLSNNKPQKALEHFLKIPHFHPAYPRAQQRCGEILVLFGLKKDACDFFQIVLKHEPNNSEVKSALSSAAATSVGDLLVDKDTQYILRGEKFSEIGQAALAYKCFERVSKQSSKPSKYNEALIGMGEALFNLRLLEKAAKMFREVLQSEPKNPLAINGLNEALIMITDGSVLDDDKRVAKLITDGYSFLSIGCIADAMYCFQAVSQNRPEYSPALVGLGEVFLEANLPVDAKRMFEQALEVDPENEAATQGLENAELASKMFIIPPAASVASRPF